MKEIHLAKRTNFGNRHWRTAEIKSDFNKKK